MDYRFIVAGILVGTIGFVGGSVVYAAPPPPPEPVLAQLANERASLNDEATGKASAPGRATNVSNAVQAGTNEGDEG